MIIFSNLKGQPVQLFALVCIELAAKTLNVSVPLNKLLKFSSYKFSIEQMVAAEYKVLDALDFCTDMMYRADDLFSMVNISLQSIKPMLSSHG